MMNNTLKSLCKVNPGTIIEGKWHHNRYTIISELGFGANGIVYLAQIGNKKVALKMSDNGMSVTSEVNVLKSFSKVQGSSLGPSLIDVDDWVRQRGLVSFYVMEYIKGPDFLSFIHDRGKTWVNILILQLLNDLQTLHEKGWIFGDLKPENLIVMGPPPKIRCIDVGGTTIQGRAIKEFTEFYDRGYWGLGTRKAEPGYDLFAVGMIFINTEYPKRFNKTTGGINELRDMVKQKSELQKFEGVILNALQGRYQTAKEMRSDLLKTIDAQMTTKDVSYKNVTKRNGMNQHQNKSRQSLRKNKRKSRWFETFSILLVISFLYLMYIIGQIS